MDHGDIRCLGNWRRTIWRLYCFCNFSVNRRLFQHKKFGPKKKNQYFHAERNLNSTLLDQFGILFWIECGPLTYCFEPIHPLNVKSTVLYSICLLTLATTRVISKQRDGCTGCLLHHINPTSISEGEVSSFPFSLVGEVSCTFESFSCLRDWETLLRSIKLDSVHTFSKREN